MKSFFSSLNVFFSIFFFGQTCTFPDIESYILTDKVFVLLYILLSWACCTFLLHARKAVFFPSPFSLSNPYLAVCIWLDVTNLNVLAADKNNHFIFFCA